jgi:hypothetical protein
MTQNPPLKTTGFTPTTAPNNQYIRITTLQDVQNVCSSTVSQEDYYAALYTGQHDLWDPNTSHMRLAFHCSPEQSYFIPPKNTSDSPLNGKLI